LPEPDLPAVIPAKQTMIAVDASRMKKIARIFIILSLLLSWAFLPVATARVYIDIDSPGFQKFPLAIADFRQLGGEKTPANLSFWFPDEIARYLEMTDYFQIKDRRAFLEPAVISATEPFKVVFPDWTTIGVDYLVKGAFTPRGAVLTGEIRIYDTIKAQEVFRKTYTGNFDGKSVLARNMAGDILSALTGTAGLFDTKIGFTQKTSQGAEIFSVSFDGSSPVKLTSESALVVSPHWSPDGRYLSYTSYRSGTQAVYIKDLKQKITRRVTPYPGMNLAGPWSPDGRKMLLTLSKDGNEEIYTLEIATGTLTRITRHFAIDVSPAWSPDGKRIVFVSNRSGSPQIYIMNEDGTATVRISDEGNYNTSPAWSPRGDRIAYESRTGGGFQIFTVNLQGEDRQAMTSPEKGTHEKPAWSPDGRYLAVISRQGGRHRIVVIGGNSSLERKIYETERKCNGLTWSR
jgi:TolB protein